MDTRLEEGDHIENAMKRDRDEIYMRKTSRLWRAEKNDTTYG